MRNVDNFGTRKYGCLEMQNSGNFDANTHVNPKDGVEAIIDFIPQH